MFKTNAKRIKTKFSSWSFHTSAQKLGHWLSFSFIEATSSVYLSSEVLFKISAIRGVGPSPGRSQAPAPRSLAIVETSSLTLPAVVPWPVLHHSRQSSPQNTSFIISSYNSSLRKFQRLPVAPRFKVQSSDGYQWSQTPESHSRPSPCSPSPSSARSLPL